MLHPETCEHCQAVIELFQEAEQRRAPPSEIVRQALLLGIAISALGIAEVAPMCEECRSRLEKLREAFAAPGSEEVAENETEEAENDLEDSRAAMGVNEGIDGDPDPQETREAVDDIA
jgi:hypothetical protein